MSSTLVPTQPSTTEDPSATSTQTGSGNVNPLTTTGSSLYLFTFLTTLLLLLGVSCAIIVRSLILRRRFRRRVQEAIANGVFVPGLMDRPGRELGEKPKMYEVWVGEPEDGLIHKKEGIVWDGVVPVSATKVPPPSKPRTPPPQPPTSSNSRRLPPFLSRGPRHVSRTTPPSPTLFEKPALIPSSPTSSTPAVQLSLLIAMPSRARPFSRAPSAASSSSSTERVSEESIDPKGKLRDTSIGSSGHSWSGLEDGEIPHVELGVVEVELKGEKDKNVNVKEES